MTQSKALSFFANHWRGQLSLPVSFWVNGLLLSVIFRELITGVPWDRLAISYPRACSSAIMVLWVASLPLAVWQYVGVFRSANAYVKSDRPKLWSWLARIVAALAIARVVAEIGLVGAPQIYQHAHIALGRDALGFYEIRVISSGKEIEVSGVIAFGLTDDILRLLSENPNVHTIRLNSKGGRTIEARNLRDLIDRKGLTTASTNECLSACTLAFAAGKQRLVVPGARLGFHRYRFPGLSEEDARRQQEVDRRDWLARGFSAAMIDRAFSSDEIWAPEHRDLLRWGVITGYLGDGQEAGTQPKSEAPR